MAQIDFTIPTGITWRQYIIRKDKAGNRIPNTGMHASLEIRQRPGGQVFVRISSAERTVLLDEDDDLPIPIRRRVILTRD